MKADKTFFVLLSSSFVEHGRIGKGLGRRVKKVQNGEEKKSNFNKITLLKKAYNEKYLTQNVHICK